MATVPMAKGEKMPRYIDIEPIEKAAHDYGYLVVSIALINEQPTADVIEVVRCKDCRKWCICHHSDDYFCADGERREEE